MPVLAEPPASRRHLAPSSVNPVGPIHLECDTSPAEPHPKRYDRFPADAWIAKRNAGWGEVSRELANEFVRPE